MAEQGFRPRSVQVLVGCFICYTTLLLYSAIRIMHTVLLLYVLVLAHVVSSQTSSYIFVSFSTVICLCHFSMTLHVAGNTLEGQKYVSLIVAEVLHFPKALLMPSYFQMRYPLYLTIHTIFVFFCHIYKIYFVHIFAVTDISACISERYTCLA